MTPDDEGKRRTKYVAVTMTPEEHRGFLKRAAAEGLRVVQLARRLLGLTED